MKGYCVNDETMMDYLEGRLDRRMRERVEKHLCTCEDCRDLLMLAGELIHGGADDLLDTVPAAVTQRAIETVGSISDGCGQMRRHLLCGSRKILAGGRSLLDAVSAGPMPRFADLRGGTKVIEDDYIRDRVIGSDFETCIEIEKVEDTHFTLQVTLTSVTPLETPLRVSLFSVGREITSAALVDEVVQLEDIPCGRYTLIFSRNNQQLNVYEFEI